MASAQQMLLEGVSDAACFMLGALGGYVLGQALGMDIFADGYGASSMAGILMVGLGAGAGLHIARIWRGRQASKKQRDEAHVD